MDQTTDITVENCLGHGDVATVANRSTGVDRQIVNLVAQGEVCDHITSSAMRSENPFNRFLLLDIQLPRAGQTSRSAFRTMVDGMAQSFLLFSSGSGL